MLRSVVGMVHVLRSRLVMDYTQAYTSKRRILIEVLPVPNAYTKSANACIHYTLWIPNDHIDLCQTHCVQVPDFS